MFANIRIQNFCMLLILALFTLTVSGCLDTEKETKSNLKPQVSSVSIANNVLTINGSDLDQVKDLKIKAAGLTAGLSKS